MPTMKFGQTIDGLLMRIQLVFLSILLGLFDFAIANETQSPQLPGTAPLQITGDIASQLVTAADRFLLKQLDRAPSSVKDTGIAS